MGMGMESLWNGVENWTKYHYINKLLNIFSGQQFYSLEGDVLTIFEQNSLDHLLAHLDILEMIEFECPIFDKNFQPVVFFASLTEGKESFSWAVWWGQRWHEPQVVTWFSPHMCYVHLLHHFLCINHLYWCPVANMPISYIAGSIKSEGISRAHRCS